MFWQKSLGRGMLPLSMVLAMLVGCSSGGGRAEESTKAVTSLAKTRDDLTTFKGSVNTAMAAIDTLSAGTGDMAAAFKNYSSAVAGVQSSGEKARATWADMRERGKQYVEKWQAEIATINDPQIKESQEKREERVAAIYDNVATSATQTRQAYDTFLKSLQDIQKAASLDLTAAGIQGLGPAFTRTKGEGKTLLTSTDELIVQLDSVIKGMSPTTAPAK